MKTKKIDFECPKKGRKITNLVKKAKSEGFEAVQFLDTLIVFHDVSMPKITSKPIENKGQTEYFGIKINSQYFHDFNKPLQEEPKPFSKWYLDAMFGQIVTYFANQFKKEENVSINLSRISL